MLRLLLVAITLSVFAGCTERTEEVILVEMSTEEAIEQDLGKHFTNIHPDSATFVLLDGDTGKIIRHNAKRAAEQMLPASTYKIPHSLIALETGVAGGINHTIAWDSVANPPTGFWLDAWSQDQTLESAIKHSVVWYYRSLAREIGPERMRQYLMQFDYGNKQIGDEIDRFWLRGNFAISANGQVEFLRKLYEGKLGVSEENANIVKQIIVLEETDEYTLSGKTGTLSPSPQSALVWLVGAVEVGDNTWYYALNLEGREAWDTWGAGAKRLILVKNLLKSLNVIQ